MPNLLLTNVMHIMCTCMHKILINDRSPALLYFYKISVNLRQFIVVLNFLLVSITGLLLGSSGVFSSGSQVHSSQSVLQHFCFGLRSTLITKITKSIRNTRTRIRPYDSFCKSADNEFCDFHIVNELN